MVMKKNVVNELKKLWKKKFVMIYLLPINYITLIIINNKSELYAKKSLNDIRLDHLDFYRIQFSIV